MKGVKAYRGVGAGHCGGCERGANNALRGKTTARAVAYKLAALSVRRQRPARSFCLCAQGRDLSVPARFLCCGFFLLPCRWEGRTRVNCRKTL